MPTTTIRVDRDTHAQLIELSRASGGSLIDTVREAAEALRRQRFADRAAADVAALRAKPDEWADYLAEAEATFVPDGIG